MGREVRCPQASKLASSAKGQVVQQDVEPNRNSQCSWLFSLYVDVEKWCDFVGVSPVSGDVCGSISTPTFSRSHKNGGTKANKNTTIIQHTTC